MLAPSSRRPWWPLAVIAAAVVLLLPALAHAAEPDPATLDQYQGWGLLALYGTAFTAGIGASLTPCVYPMIPIVLGVFGARGKDVSRKKSLTLATLYVLGMGATYATLGTVFTLLGRQFSAVLSEPAVVLPLVGLYVVLAVSMFGAFELNLPASLQTRLAQVGGSGYGGAFAMGLVGGFTAAPCTGPFVAGLLTAVARTGDVTIGASTLFVHALGIGVLYWVLAVFAGALPRSGRWMEWVKAIGGMGLLVAALYFLRPIWPWLRGLGSPSITFAALAAGLVVAGLALGAVHRGFRDGGGTSRLLAPARKGLAVLLVVGGAYGLIAWVLAPKRHLPWQHDEAAAFALARAEGKGVMVDFSATWCTPCVELERTFGEDAVYPTLSDHFVPLKFDVSGDTDADIQRKNTYGVTSLPAVVFVSTDGSVLGRVNQDTPDYLSPGGFMKVAGPAARAVASSRGAAALAPPTR